MGFFFFWEGEGFFRDVGWVLGGGRRVEFILEE